MSYAAGRSRADLDDDELLRLALTKLIEIVGEAAKHTSDDLRESRRRCRGRRLRGCETGSSTITSTSTWTFSRAQ